jgi:hypothetical protein
MERSGHVQSNSR